MVTGLDEKMLLEQTRRRLQLAPADFIRLTPIFKGGSSRSFFRVELPPERSVILMEYSPDKEENAYFVHIADFLASLHIDVPLVLFHDQERHLVWMQDLGGIDLHSMRDDPWDERKQAYFAALDAAGRLHRDAPAAFDAKPFPLMRGFDAHLYNWEHDYFFENFVVGFCQLRDERADKARLRNELGGLIERLAAAGSTLIHRDLQSQNVMMQKRRACLIDFQGLRHGTLFYDLGSLLYDPYVSFYEAEREELLDFYFDHFLRNGQSPGGSREADRRLFWDASAQRLMQALGAYGYLGLNQGKTHFLDHIPAALERLSETARHSGRLPALHGLVQRCAEATRARAPQPLF
ncbi:MAG: phosphotransferase [Verrucomicrobiota bacterium]